MASKLFIVAAGNEATYRSLCKVLETESSVEVVYDRRRPQRRRLPTQSDRRAPSDVDELIRTVGYAIVRVPDAAIDNVRFPRRHVGRTPTRSPARYP
jgi:hypothetical protein